MKHPIATFVLAVLAMAGAAPGPLQAQGDGPQECVGKYDGRVESRVLDVSKVIVIQGNSCRDGVVSYLFSVASEQMVEFAVRSPETYPDLVLKSGPGAPPSAPIIFATAQPATEDGHTARLAHRLHPGVIYVVRTENPTDDGRRGPYTLQVTPRPDVPAPPQAPGQHSACPAYTGELVSKANFVGDVGSASCGFAGDSVADAFVLNMLSAGRRSLTLNVGKAQVRLKVYDACANELRPYLTLSHQTTPGDTLTANFFVFGPGRHTVFVTAPRGKKHEYRLRLSRLPAADSTRRAPEPPRCAPAPGR